MPVRWLIPDRDGTDQNRGPWAIRRQPGWGTRLGCAADRRAWTGGRCAFGCQDLRPWCALDRRL